MTLGTKGAGFTFLTQVSKKGGGFFIGLFKPLYRSVSTIEKKKRFEQSYIHHHIFLDISNYWNNLIDMDAFIKLWNDKISKFKNKEYLIEFSLFIHAKEPLNFQRINDIGLSKAFNTKNMDSMFAHLNKLNQIGTIYNNKGYYIFFKHRNITDINPSFIFELISKKIDNQKEDNYFVDISKQLYIKITEQLNTYEPSIRSNYNNKIPCWKRCYSTKIEKPLSTQQDLLTKQDLLTYKEKDLSRLAGFNNENDLALFKDKLIRYMADKLNKINKVNDSDKTSKIIIRDMVLTTKVLNYSSIIDFEIFTMKVNYSLKGEVKEQILTIKIVPTFKDLSEIDLFNGIESFLNKIKDIKSRGFITPQSPEEYGLVSDLIPILCEKPLKDIKDVKYATIISKILNIVILNMLIAIDKKMGDVLIKEDKNTTDIQADYINKYKVLKGLLDPFIRLNIQKRGISIYQNTYIGFDTEYELKDSMTNELISIALAVNTKTILKIPKNLNLSDHDFNLESDILKDLEFFNNDIFKDIIKNGVISYRNLKYWKHDLSLNHLIRGLNGLIEAGKYNIQTMNDDSYNYFSFSRTPVRKGIYINKDNNYKGYSLSDVIEISKNMVKYDLNATYEQIMNTLRNLYDNLEMRELEEIKVKDDYNSDYKLLTNDYELEETKKMSRSMMNSFTQDLVNVTKIRNIYLVAHLTNADLCMLNDFGSFKEDLNIVNSSFVTMGKPLIIGSNRVFIRDTMLLSPAGNQSLESLGKLYKNNKVSLGNRDKSKMLTILENDKNLFIEYALQDSVITLTHACFMEDFNFNLNKIGIPLTLSSLGTSYVKNRWSLMEYKGYQINPDMYIGDASAFMTPRGLKDNLDIALALPLFISSYKGGRNESYMYGTDNNTLWFDYDLTSAYTTGMSIIGDPLYSQLKRLSIKELDKLPDLSIINSFTVIKADFTFPNNTKFPSIPVFLDKTTTVYPISGSCCITGIEYVLAKNQGCVFTKITDIVRVPFGSIKPFEDILKEIQAKRREYEKGSISNLLYKEMGNSIYGNTVRGISNKKKFDIKTGTLLRMEAGELSNPLIGSWITAFVRSVVGECLHNIDFLEGKVISCTTDGFITNIDDLENKIGNLKVNTFIKLYQKIREDLSNNPTSLELKHKGEGIISWSTRGQFSLNSGIAATTGFQRRQFDPSYIEVLFKNKLSSEDKTLEFIQQRLRSALDIYRKGGHVTKTYSDRLFRLHFDNRRIIEITKGLENNKDYSNTLLDSKPASSIDTIKYLRSMSKIEVKPTFDKRLSDLTVSSNKYKDFTDIAIRNFVKAILSNKVEGIEFPDYKSLIDFVKDYKKDFKISKSSISHLKNKPIIFKSLPMTDEVKAFYDYVKKIYPNFDISKIDNE